MSTITERETDLPPAHRFTYFPPTQIFGKTLVPIYYSGARPTIPIVHVAKAMGVPFKTAFSVIMSQRDSFDIHDAATGELVHPSAPLERLRHTLCLGMDGICALIFALDLNRVKDRLTRARLVAAKRWLSCQVSNRIKISGRKNQTRWDAGLTKEQAEKLKEHFTRINGPQTREAI